MLSCPSPQLRNRTHYSTLHALYKQILDTVPKSMLPILKPLLAYPLTVTTHVYYHDMPDHGFPLGLEATLFSLQQHTVYAALRKLHSVIKVPPLEESGFRNSGECAIEPEEFYMKVWRGCFEFAKDLPIQIRLEASELEEVFRNINFDRLAYPRGDSSYAADLFRFAKWLISEDVPSVLTQSGLVETRALADIVLPRTELSENLAIKGEWRGPVDYSGPSEARGLDYTQLECNWTSAYTDAPKEFYYDDWCYNVMPAAQLTSELTALHENGPDSVFIMVGRSPKSLWQGHFLDIPCRWGNHSAPNSVFKIAAAERGRNGQIAVETSFDKSLYADSMHKREHDRVRKSFIMEPDTRKEIYTFPKGGKDEYERLETQHGLWATLLNGLYPQEVKSEVERKLKDSHAPAILDVGCGSGIWSIQMARLFPQAKVIGLDITPLGDRDFPPNFSFVCCNFSDGLPTEMKSIFDIVHCRTVTQHVPDPHGLVDSMAEALKPGGLLFLADIDFISYDESQKRLEPVVYRPSLGIAENMQQQEGLSWHSGWMAALGGISLSPSYEMPNILVQRSKFLRILLATEFWMTYGLLEGNCDDERMKRVHELAMENLRVRHCASLGSAIDLSPADGVRISIGALSIDSRYILQNPKADSRTLQEYVNRKGVPRIDNTETKQ
ncbi:hypothetical protein NP233_g2535 [Leucocoprinus birnbaumii]|uniref:Methyltransferase domain-containing protein n=1 Tax=Leucocoprinus birnbaumii TaxID=56174 RepID=A0AAD5YUT2_9AGAR|nr:hypothetical protein NP233_g2535 [Leucocoprinus birnbaumii]